MNQQSRVNFLVCDSTGWQIVIKIPELFAALDLIFINTSVGKYVIVTPSRRGMDGSWESGDYDMKWNCTLEHCQNVIHKCELIKSSGKEDVTL